MPNQSIAASPADYVRVRTKAHARVLATGRPTSLKDIVHEALDLYFSTVQADERADGRASHGEYPIQEPEIRAKPVA